METVAATLLWIPISVLLSIPIGTLIGCRISGLQ
jgi:hypothetical protein